MTTTFRLDGPVDRAEIPALCERLRTVLAREGAGPVVFDISSLEGPDAATVEALARLQLTALRSGRRIRLRSACCELQDLLALVGLVELLPVVEPAGRSRVEPLRLTEQREELRGVEEERDPGDPAA
ncbi:MAG TPA: STAS domain-containing protein [Actinomycetota bacterium]|nr:STAS domain-containing protein [Actinomycetota bacterium]